MITWDVFYTYLLTVRRLKIDKNKKREKHNYDVESSRFNAIYSHFVEKSFNRQNCDLFLSSYGDKSNSTFNNYVKVIRNICKAMRYHQMESDKILTPIEQIEYLPKTRKKHIDILTPIEIRKIAELRISYGKARIQTNRRWRSILYTLALGLRIGELRDLRWDDYKGDHFVIVDGKTPNARRLIYVPQKLAALIEQLPRYEHNYIFGSHQGPLYGGAANDEIRIRTKLLGIRKKITAHSFRHSFIHNSLKAGMPLVSVMTHVGHKDPQVTMQYKHFGLEETKIVVEAYEVFKTKTVDKMKEALISRIQQVHNKDILQSLHALIPTPSN